MIKPSSFEDIRKLSDVEIAARLAILEAMGRYGGHMASWQIEESAMLNTERINRTWPDYVHGPSPEAERPDISINGHRREVLAGIKRDLDRLLEKRSYYGEFLLGFKSAKAIVDSYLNEELKK